MTSVDSLYYNTLISTANGLTGAAASLSPTKSVDSSDIDAVAKDFESVFMTQMLEQLFSGESANGYFGQGAAGEIYKGFLMTEYGRAITNAGGIGIASMVKKELLKQQEVRK